MNFSNYVKKYGSEESAIITTIPGFPVDGKYRSLKLFVNTNKFTDDINAELEDLHDQFWLEGGGND